jgi:NTE family protein
MTGRLAAMVAPLLLAGCATFSSQLKNGPDPRFEPPEPLEAIDPGVALVLSGGAARGYAHVGVIRVLEANGLRPSIVVGSSAGSVVGSLYASGLFGVELEKAVAELTRGTFNDWVLPSFGVFPGGLGFVKGDKLHRFIDDRARHHMIERFPIRFAAVATDLRTGESQIFNAGDVGAAVRASSAVPGIIAPAEIAGHLYGDGQISSPVPVAAARKLGARRIIAIDVIYPPEDAFISSAMGVLFQAFNISTYRLRRLELAQADVVISPELPRTSGQMSFADRDQLIAAGERAAVQALEKIRPLFRPIQAETSK